MPEEAAFCQWLREKCGLGDGYALAHGRFALKRTAAGGGDSTGRFTLVLRRTPQGWRIIHVHSS